MGSNGKYSTKIMIDAIEGSQGFITTVAGRIGCPRDTVYRYIKKYPTVAQAIQDERDKMKDFAEGQLFKNIKDGKETSLIFYLKTQAKDRGYIESNPNINIDLERLSDDQIDRLIGGESAERIATSNSG